MNTFITALNKKRASFGRDEKGFTLIELLVVVIIIGILAAIAIPVYIGVQNSAKDSSAKTDLANAKIAVIAYYTNTPAASAFPTLSTLGDYGYSGSTVVANTNASAGAASQANFCLKSNNGNQVFYVTNSTGPLTAKAANCT